jgi:hypothetical protein
MVFAFRQLALAFAGPVPTLRGDAHPKKPASPPACHAVALPSPQVWRSRRSEPVGAAASGGLAAAAATPGNRDWQ